MFRERLVTTTATSASAKLLQKRLLDFHDFRQYKARHPLASELQALGDWQARRLKSTHDDLYLQPRYRQGLEFLLTDLYAPAGMPGRDDNIDRIFPKLIKWLPEHLLATLADLIHLNHLTQTLDLSLLETLTHRGENPRTLAAAGYCEAFREGGHPEDRQRQIALVADVGHQLDRYIKNRSLGWLLAISKTPAEMAELTDLHSFLHRGYRAFQTMERVDALIAEVVSREQQVLAQILAGNPEPFIIPTPQPPPLQSQREPRLG